MVSASGPIQLSSRPVTVDAVAGMLTQLLPADSRRVLDELGAVEYDLPPSAFADGERFTAVVARGGDEIRIEIRRHRVWPKHEPGPVSAPPAVEEKPDPQPAPDPVEPAAPEPVVTAAPEPVVDRCAGA